MSPDGVMPLPDFRDLAKKPRKKDRQKENAKVGCVFFFIFLFFCGCCSVYFFIFLYSKYIYRLCWYLRFYFIIIFVCPAPLISQAYIMGGTKTPLSIFLKSETIGAECSGHGLRSGLPIGFVSYCMQYNAEHKKIGGAEKRSCLFLLKRAARDKKHWRL